MNNLDLSLYLVTNNSEDEEKFLNIIEESLKGGVSVVQLREKKAETLDFYNLALKVKEITQKYNVPLIINDRIDIALAIDADGVHVGQSDMPAKTARSMIGEDKILGVSAANIKEAKKAQRDSADYIGVGAVYPTNTKDDATSVPKKELKEIVKSVDIPVVAIGGITQENAHELNDCGIDGLSVVKAALMKERSSGADYQGALFTDEELGIVAKEVEAKWNKLLEKEKANRTVFAQRAMHPEDVAPEWEKTKKALGDSKDVERFFTETSKRLNIGLEPQEEGSYILNITTLPVELRKQIAPIVKTTKSGLLKISFEYPPKQGYTFLQRSNPVVTNFASYLLEGALSPNTKSPAARCGAYLSDKVSGEIITIYLLRIRYQIKTTGSRKILMAEESVVLGIQGRSNPKVIADDDVEKLLNGKPTGNLSSEKISEEVKNSIEYYSSNKNVFDEIAKVRAEQLAQDHTSVRKATNIDQKSVKVEACLPCDLIGVYVLLPDEEL